MKAVSEILVFLFVRHSSLSIGEGNGNPFQYSCLENPIHRGAIGRKSWTRLSDYNDDDMIPLLNYFI